MAVLSDHRYMRSGFAFLADGMETRDFAGLDFQVCLLSSKERVSIDGQSINSRWGKKKAAIIWAARAHVGCVPLQNTDPWDSSRITVICKIKQSCWVFIDKV